MATRWKNIPLHIFKGRDLHSKFFENVEVNLFTHSRIEIFFCAKPLKHFVEILYQHPRSTISRNKILKVLTAGFFVRFNLGFLFCFQKIFYVQKFPFTHYSKSYRVILIIKNHRPIVFLVSGHGIVFHHEIKKFPSFRKIERDIISKPYLSKTTPNHENNSKNLSTILYGKKHRKQTSIFVKAEKTLSERSHFQNIF